MKRIGIRKVSLRKTELLVVKSGVSVGSPDEDGKYQFIPIYLKWDDGSSVLFDNGDAIVAGLHRVPITKSVE